MWTPKGKRPIVLTSGSHQKTCVFGALCIDGRQFFRQYSTFNQDTFLQYLKELQRKFRKLILFLDRAAQHYRSSKVRKHLEESKGVIRVEYLPKGSPGLSAPQLFPSQWYYNNSASKLEISNERVHTSGLLQNHLVHG